MSCPLCIEAWAEKQESLVQSSGCLGRQDPTLSTGQHAMNGPHQIQTDSSKSVKAPGFQSVRVVMSVGSAIKAGAIMHGESRVRSSRLVAEQLYINIRNIMSEAGRTQKVVFQCQGGCGGKGALIYCWWEWKIGTATDADTWRTLKKLKIELL